MPTKFSQGTWTKVRQRMNELIAQGIDEKIAATKVSREFSGRPAAGTILNRSRNGWRVQGANARNGNGSNGDALKALQQQNIRLQAEVDTLRQQLIDAEKEAARAQGAADVLKEVVDIDNHVNGHGLPAL